MREFGRDRFLESGKRKTIRGRQCDYFLRFAEETVNVGVIMTHCVGVKLTHADHNDGREAVDVN
jgi:hypothetical protein